jgi:hypothetical protein
MVSRSLESAGVKIFRSAEITDAETEIKQHVNQLRCPQENVSPPMSYMPHNIKLYDQVCEHLLL